MKRIKSFSYRVLVSLLLVLALNSTYFNITGVKAQSLIQLDEYSNEGFGKGLLHVFRSLGLSLKSLKHSSPTSLEISSSATIEAPQTLEDSEDWSKYPKMKVTATGYTAGFESTGKYASSPEYGITYSGVKVKRDLFSTVAADLRVFPIGTILFIPGYGYGVVADKGGAIKGNELDLYYKTVEDVYTNWGKKTLNVYVIKRGDGHLTEEALKNLNEKEDLQVFRQQFMKKINN